MIDFEVDETSQGLILKQTDSRQTKAIHAVTTTCFDCRVKRKKHGH